MEANAMADTEYDYSYLLIKNPLTIVFLFIYFRIKKKIHHFFSKNTSNSVKYLSGIDFFEEPKKNILENAIGTSRIDLKSKAIIKSPRNPIGTLSYYDPDFVKKTHYLSK